MKKQTVAQTLKERNKTHGDFVEQAETAQCLKELIRDTPSWAQLSYDQREALELDATKTSRILHGDPNHVDSWHDKAGYATLIVNRLEKE